MKKPNHPRPDNLPFHYQYRYSAKQADYYRGEGTQSAEIRASGWNTYRTHGM